MFCGVDVVDADPPVGNGTVLAAYSSQEDQTGVNSLQSTSKIISNPIRGGTICGGWINTNAGIGNLRKAAGPVLNKPSLAANAALFSESVAWSSGLQIYLTVSFRGYS